MGSIVRNAFDVKRIAIIGAGPCGLAAAKYLLAQKAFPHITVYEQQDEVGGVWDYSPLPSRTPRVPQTSPFYPPDPPVERGGDVPPVFPTPMYEQLNTNIPSTLMKFSDLAFDKQSPIFPTRQGVQDYLVKYTEEIRHLIHFSTEVERIELRTGSGEDQWEVYAKSTVSGDTSSHTYDAVVVASGHYSVPFIPAVDDIAGFHAKHPHVISHAKQYRSPEPFKDKKVVVVGNSASGLDIARQVNAVCKRPLLLSVRTPTPPPALDHAGCTEVPVITRFLPGEERGVEFKDGQVERDVDAVVYCTGYFYSFPFLESLEPPLVHKGRRVHGIYKHLIHIDHPTLVFPGLPYKVVPFPLSESQAAYFARVWANTMQLPSREEMRRWEEEEEKKVRRGELQSIHIFPKGGDGEYINDMYDLIEKEAPEGKTPPRWDGQSIWERQIYAEAKLAFEKQGRTAKSLKELGFKYNPSEMGDEKAEIL